MRSMAFVNGTVVLPDRQLNDGMVCCDRLKDRRRRPAEITAE